MLLLTFEPIKNQEKIEKKKSKLQEDIHEESIEDYPSWW
jgi:hypothetical protein